MQSAARAAVDEILDDPSEGVEVGGHDLRSALGDALLEQLLERPDARTSRRSFTRDVPAMAVRLTLRRIEAPRAEHVEAIGRIAVLAIRTFVDRGMFAVLRPNRWPTLVLPLPDPDEPGIHEAVAFARELDDAQLRAAVLGWAERFHADARRLLSDVGLVAAVRLGEGQIVDPPAASGLLLPGSCWQIA